VPLVDPVGGFPPAVYWNTEEILNLARILVNDVQGGLSGQDLSDAQPYTWPLLNFCYSKLANWLEDNNVESAMYAEEIISLPPSAVVYDPSLQSRLGYDGFNVGVGIDNTVGFHYDLPTLPVDPYLLEPLQLWQRPTGQTCPFMEMQQRLGGLGTVYGNWMYGDWEFRQNSIYLTGGTTTGIDLRIRYIPALPELVQPTEEAPDFPMIWFARAGEALAYMVAAEFAEIRNSKNAPTLRAKANEQLQIIANKSAKRANNSQTRRRGYGFSRGRVARGYTVYG